MEISARNVLAGTVQHIERGPVNAEVSIELKGGEPLVAIITNTSVDALHLAEGKPVFGIVKASEVMIGQNVEHSRLSARNTLTGEVAAITDGAVNSEVVVRLSGGSEMVASITRASVHRLGLKVGDKVTAIVKASNVIIGV